MPFSKFPIPAVSPFSKSEVLGNRVKVVNQESDFPAAVGGVITLDPTVDNVDCWLIGASVVLFSGATLKIAPGQIVSINGYDSACAVITTRNGAVPTIDVTGATLTTQRMTWNNLGNQPIFFAAASVAGAAVFGHRLVINNCDVVCDITDGRNMGWTEIRIIQSASGCFKYSGTFSGGVQAQDILTDPTAVGPFIDLGTSVVQTSINIDTVFIDPAFTGDFIVGAASNGNLDPNRFATVTGCNFLSSGASITGVSLNDTRWLFSGNDGIADSRAEGVLSFSGNATNTTFGAPGDTTVIQATYVVGITSQFTGDAAGTLTCDSEIVREGVASISGVIIKPAGGAADEYNIEVFDDGVSKGGLQGLELRADSLPFAFAVPVLKDNASVFDVRVTAVGDTNSVTVISMNFAVT